MTPLAKKKIELFFTENETLDLNRFNSIGIIKPNSELNFNDKTASFTKSINHLKAEKSWTKEDLITLFHKILPNFTHKETGKYLDHKM